MKFLLLLSCIIAYVTHGSFERYEGGNCAYVYDSNEESFFPLNKCIPNYWASDDRYHSQEYNAIIEDGVIRVERNTYYTEDCSDDVQDNIKDVLDEINPIYNNPNISESEDCYLEYIQYSSCPNNDDFNISSWSTKYIITSACITNQYSICDNKTVSYVRFNDDTCCDLSYSYQGNDGPLWKLYDDIIVGCNENNNVYIDPDSWNCILPQEANNNNVYSDNDDPECKDDAFIITTISSYILIFIYYMF